MKRVIAIILAVAMCFSAMSIVSIAETDIKVTLNGVEIEFDQQPIIEENRTLVPMRKIFEAMGATVEWNGESQTVTGTKDYTVVKMQIGNTVMTKNGQDITLDVPPRILNGRTLVPVRAVAEIFDAAVDWDDENQTVVIMTDGQPAPAPSEAQNSIFAELPENFYFASGVGGWGTEIHINVDGTFEGYHSDSNMGETGPGFPNGTRYECIFSGKFGNVIKINEYEYSISLEYLHTEGTVGASKIEGGIKYITSTPYGFDDAGEFLLYLPGRSTSDLHEEFIWWMQAPNAWRTVPETLPFYALYNVGGQQGFFS